MDRWDRLFADLEATVQAETQAELLAEVNERTRREIGTFGLAARLRAAVGGRVAVDLPGWPALSGRLRRAGSDWLLIGDRSDDGDGTAVVPLSAIMAVSGLAMGVRQVEGVIEARMDFRYVLRGLVRDRRGVRVHTADGRQRSGTLDRVGADYVDLAAHPAGEARRTRSVSGVATIPLTAVSAVVLT